MLLLRRKYWLSKILSLKHFFLSAVRNFKHKKGSSVRELPFFLPSPFGKFEIGGLTHRAPPENPPGFTLT